MQEEDRLGFLFQGGISVWGGVQGGDGQSRDQLRVEVWKEGQILQKGSVLCAISSIGRCFRIVD